MALKLGKGKGSFIIYGMGKVHYLRDGGISVWLDLTGKY